MCCPRLLSRLPLEPLVLLPLLVAAPAGPLGALDLSRSRAVLLADGKPVELRGYGCYGMVAERSFDYEAFLDLLRDRHGLNLVRVWMNFHWAADLTPFAGDLSERYDLVAQNDAFYERLRAFVAYADLKGVAVQVSLFDGVALSGDPGTNRWPLSPYNTANNRQSYLAQPLDFQRVPSAWWNEVNAPLIDRAVSELGSFGNVIYEVMNEPDAHGIDAGMEPGDVRFHRSAVERLHERLHRPEVTGSRLISVNPSRPGLLDWARSSEKVDLISWHVKDPRQGGDLAGLGKPVIVSNDGDLSQLSFELGGLPGPDRIARIQALLDATFGLGAPPGHNHLELVDKGLYGASWLSLDYDPRVELADPEILEALAGYTPPPLDPERPVLAVTSVVPAGRALWGSTTLWSIEVEGGLVVDGLQAPAAVELEGSFTAGRARGLPDLPASRTGGAVLGLDLGYALLGLDAPGESVAVFFDASFRADGTPRPELFVLEWALTNDSFQIELLGNGPGEPPLVRGRIQIVSGDFVETSTSVDTTGTGVQPVAGVAVDLDRLGRPAGTLRGIRIPAADGLGGLTGLDPAVLAVVPAASGGRSAFIRGDCDGDGRVTGSVADAVFLLRFTFLGGFGPPCLAACDPNGDGRVAGSVTDSVYILHFNFLGGPPPVEPYPFCGTGRAGDELSCDSSPPCE